jgi:hypothetical protein
MTRDRLLKRVDELLQQGKAVLASRQRSAHSGEYVDSGKIKGFRSAAMSFIERLYGSAHSHYREFDKEVCGYRPSDAEIGMAILESAHAEIAGDWLFSLKGFITAEVFADFIEMANYLMDQDYKDAAAVIAGSVLEEHLRQLCRSNNIRSVCLASTELRPTRLPNRRLPDLGHCAPAGAL